MGILTRKAVDTQSLIAPALLEGWRADVARVAGPYCGELFAAAMTRTLERTLHRLPDGTVFVITGDIPAMWLRDSTTQLRPYLRLVAADPDAAGRAGGRGDPPPDDLDRTRPVRQRVQPRTERPLSRPRGPLR